MSGELRWSSRAGDRRGWFHQARAEPARPALREGHGDHPHDPHQQLPQQIEARAGHGVGGELRELHEELDEDEKTGLHGPGVHVREVDRRRAQSRIAI